MQFFLKILFTLVALFVIGGGLWIGIAFLRFIWTNTFDLHRFKMIPSNYVNERAESLKSQIPIIDKNALYQNGIKVADVVGEVTLNHDITTFQYWVNVDNENFDVSQPFDYKGKKYKFLSMRLVMGEAHITINKKDEIFYTVKVDVQCKQLTN